LARGLGLVTQRTQPRGATRLQARFEEGAEGRSECGQLVGPRAPVAKQSVFHRGVLRCRGPATRTPEEVGQFCSMAARPCPPNQNKFTRFPARSSGRARSFRGVRSRRPWFAPPAVSPRARRRSCWPSRSAAPGSSPPKRAALKLDRRPVSLLSNCLRASSQRSWSFIPAPAPATIACTGILPGRRWLFFAMSLVKIAPRLVGRTGPFGVAECRSMHMRH
jgi:hypothetical protein